MSAARTGRRGDAPDPSERRVERALTDCMIVLEDSPISGSHPDVYEVIDAAGQSVRVDLGDGTSTCSHGEIPNVDCHHIERARLAVGRRPIPAWASVDRIDAGLGQHVDREPVVQTPDGQRPLSEVRS